MSVTDRIAVSTSARRSPKARRPQVQADPLVREAYLGTATAA